MLAVSAMLLPIIWISGVFIYINFFFNMCDVMKHGETLSPNGKTSVVIYSIDCGAATRFNTRASLTATGKEFNPKDDRQFLHVRGQYDIRVKWVDAATIEITVPNGAEAFDEENIVQREKMIDGISIFYK